MPEPSDAQAPRPLLPDDLWEAVAPLLPPAACAAPRAGRPRLSDRAVLTGIVFILKGGIAWNRLPPELECGSGMTCWRRLREWQAAGYWPRIHAVLAARLGEPGDIEWLRPALEKAGVPVATNRLRRVRHLTARRQQTAML